MRWWCERKATIFLFVALLLAVPAAGATGALAHYQHTGWTLRDGAPPDIWAMVQAEDGMLWLGTGFGIYRFDGVRFERYAPTAEVRMPTDNITALGAVGGDLWIGHYLAGFSRIRDGRLSRHPLADGLVGGLVYAIVEGADGAPWAATSEGLLRFDGREWRRVGAERGVPAGPAYWLLVDRRGGLWLAGGDRVRLLARGAMRFEDAGLASGEHAVLAQSPSGEIWMSDRRHGTRRVWPAEPTPAITPTVAARRLLFHRDGSLWGTDLLEGGMFRLAMPGSQGVLGPVRQRTLDRFDSRRGLPSDIAVPLVQDREGNVWVGTNLGLSRFRYRNVVALPEAFGPGYADYELWREDHGRVLVALGDTMFRASRASVQDLLGTGTMADATSARRNSRYWHADRSGFWRTVDGTRTRVPLPGNRPIGDLVSLAIAPGGDVWAGVHGLGALRLRDGRWRHGTGLPRDAAPTVIACDLGGNIWFGYGDGRLIALGPDGMRSFDVTQGLDVGRITAIHGGRRHLLVAGERGIARLQANGFRSLSAARLDALAGVTGILETDEDWLWLNGSRGIARLSGRELRRALDDPRGPVEHILLDAGDGVPGVARQSGIVPTAANDDGLLWFVTNRGVALVDPERLRFNQMAPHVAIREVVSGDRSYRADGPLRFPEGTSHLEFAYFATSLTAPERVRFRHRLEGVDEDWRDAGSRREAFYTNLRPGHYRFQVRAANDHGVWSSDSASIEFEIPPTFLQSRWFVLLCVAAMLALGLAAYVSHIRHVAGRLRARLEERHMERERIARELHDTLLQGYQGLILQLYAAVRGLAPGDATRRKLEQLMDRAEHALVEARDRVHELRAAASDVIALPEAFAAIAVELAEEANSELRVLVEGQPRALAPLVRDEVYRIGREALLNAYRHAGAQRIEVDIAFTRDGLRLRIRDDGRGFGEEVTLQGERSGHWGLAGMRERARRIEGRLDVWSSAGGGTEVQLDVPAAVAYRQGSLNWAGHLQRRMRRRAARAS